MSKKWQRPTVVSYAAKYRKNNRGVLEASSIACECHFLVRREFQTFLKFLANVSRILARIAFVDMS